MKTELLLLLLSLSYSRADNDLRDRFLVRSLVSPRDLPAPGSAIDVGMIMMNVNQTKHKLITYFTKMINSIFLYSTGTPLRLIFFTDEGSSGVIGQILKSQSGKYLSETVIRNPLTMKKLMLKFPPLEVVYVNTSQIFAHQKTGIHQLKLYFGAVSDKPYVETPSKHDQGVSAITWNNKYRHDLFYILPYYYLELPTTFRKLIMLDVDLEFSIDMVSLYRQFDQFSETEVIGCGVTQTPFYFKFLQGYKKNNPDTHIGGPGRYQGLNTGVLLLNLEKMRRSDLYINTTSPDVITMLRNKYTFVGSVGDQDWLTLVSFEFPSLVYILPCEYNKDEHRPGECHDDTKEEWEGKYRHYHHCHKTIKIKHKAGSI